MSYTIEQVLAMMEKQSFADWYDTDLDRYCYGSDGIVNKDSILIDLETMLKEVQNANLP